MAQAQVWAKPDTDGPPPLDPAVLQGLAGDQTAAAMPKVFTSAAPVVRMPTAQERQIGGDEGRLAKLEYQQAHPWGTNPVYDTAGTMTDPGNHPGKLGKLAHIFSSIGNIAGDIFAPSTMALIPGTALNRQVRESGLVRQLDQERLAQAQQSLLGSEAEHNQAETGLEEAQATNLENPRENPAGPIRWERETIPGQGMYDINPETHEAFPVMAGGKPLVPPAAVAKQATDAFDEWLRNPDQYQEFLKAMAANKPAKALTGSASNNGAARIAQSMLTAAYNENPALLPVLAPVIAKMLGQAGASGEDMQELQGVLGATPPGQPRNAQGTAIGLRMPEAPTGGTRSRGQFAEAVLPSITEAKKEIGALGNQLGPMAGRWNDLYVGKVGAYGPQYSRLQTELKNIGTAWMRLHANSESARQEFEGMLRGSQSPANLEANLDAIAEQAQAYVKAGQGRPGEEGGAAAPQRFTDGGTVYNIPPDQVTAFKKDHPNAR